MTVPQAQVSWRKPTRSQSEGACFEARNDLRAVRDSKNPGPTLTADLRQLVSAVKANRIH